MIPAIAAIAATAAVALAPHTAAAPTHQVYTGKLPANEAVIYTDLRDAGFTRPQTAGIMGNAYYESTFNVENHAMDSNGHRGYGLFSWNSAFYPTASKLVTGNVAKDLKAQVQFILHDTLHVKEGTAGTTAYQVGGNWARYVEVCVNCSPGGHQYIIRSQEAAAIAHQAGA